MEIDPLSEEIESTFGYHISSGAVRWNGRDIQALDKMALSANTYRKLNMSRPPDESEASIEAGYDDKRGTFVEGKWTWTWKDKDDKETSSDGKEDAAPRDPPDSGDRDFDKENGLAGLYRQLRHQQSLLSQETRKTRESDNAAKRG